MGVLTVVSEDDPVWIAAQKSVITSCKAADETAAQLLEIQPTTLAGVAVVLQHAYDCGRRGLRVPDRI